MRAARLHVIDARPSPEPEDYRVFTVEFRARTFLNVPLFKDDELLGFIGIYRTSRAFGQRQIAGREPR